MIGITVCFIKLFLDFFLKWSAGDSPDSNVHLHVVSVNCILIRKMYKDYRFCEWSLLYIKWSAIYLFTVDSIYTYCKWHES